jgi:hypothetical protein
MFRFRMSSVLWFFVTISVAAAWFVDRQLLLQELKRVNPPIKYYCEKANLWSPAAFLNRDTAALETQLSNHIEGFAGDFVTSSQGLGDYRLRQPTIQTLDAVIGLLDDESTRVSAAELIALYLQAVSGLENDDKGSLMVRAHFQLNGLPKIRQQICDTNVEVRKAIALILGNTFYSRDAEQFLVDTFDQEADQEVKRHLAWSYYNITHGE